MVIASMAETPGGLCNEALNLKPQRNPRVRWRIYKGKVIIPPAYGLNETASEIWKLCDGTRTIKDIIEHIKKNYEASPSEIEKTVIDFIFLMEKHKFILLKEE